MELLTDLVKLVDVAHIVMALGLIGSLYGAHIERKRHNEVKALIGESINRTNPKPTGGIKVEIREINIKGETVNTFEIRPTEIKNEGNQPEEEPE